MVKFEPKKRFDVHNNKKFEVHGEKKKFEVQDEGKKFIVHNDLSKHSFGENISKHSEGTKKFQIHQSTILSSEERVELSQAESISFARQKDGNSCGYCAIHNLSNLLSYSGYNGDPESIYSAVNTTREGLGLPNLERHQNLPSTDMARYLQSQGLSAFVVSGQDALREMQSGFDAAVSMNGGHYKAFGKSESGPIVEMDSLNEAPNYVSHEHMEEELKRSCFSVNGMGHTIVLIRE